jgi:catechol 2,3-dioxygenase-like lactoylglutathione lyase family enzyme
MARTTACTDRTEEPMEFRCPLVAVEDMAASRAFYETVLEQEVALDFGANITFRGGFALQTRSSWAEFIDRREEDVSRGSSDFELYFEEEEFDALLERLQAHVLDYVHLVREYPWGQRVVRFYDPDRHIVEVGESMASVVRRFVTQGLTPEETAQRTQHPLDFVRACLE